MAKQLQHFTIVPSAEGYILQLEDEDGETVELIATYDQLDVIAEAIDEQLDDDEEVALSADEDEEE